MSCPAPETKVNKDVGLGTYAMTRKVALLAQAPQLVLSVKHIYNNVIGVYLDLVCTKYACLAQPLKVCPTESGLSTSLLLDCVCTLHACAFSLCNDASMEHTCWNQLCVHQVCASFL